ncbi:MAG TPA: hypothetical protein VFI47_16095 [Acidimicrobiales bacterium]|nr:hypothetical protein [Acidimicrobiales bacterium]
MAVVRRLGKVAWSAGKGGRRLRKAARDAERPAGGGPRDATDPPEPAVDVRPTLPQAALLVRYIAGRFVLGWMQTVFLTKYALLALAVPFLVGFQPSRSEGWYFERTTFDTAVGVILVVLGVLAALVEWLAGRAVRRVGALDKLAELDDVAFDAVVDWWPNLRAEFRRVGLPPSARRMLTLGAAYATRRLTPHERAALEQVEWLAVLPREQLHEAHRVLARAADAPPAASS